jgi:hypothetical protein
MYEIHLYVPKTGRLTPSMLSWLYENGSSESQPEKYWPVRKLNPKALARVLLTLDPSLQPFPLEGGAVELRYPHEALNITLIAHERGMIIHFPYASSILIRIILGICYTYIRYLYDTLGFWSYDPQLRVLSYADDFESIDETARRMDELLPKMLNG